MAKPPKKMSKEQKLAAKLRENLKRRKQQSKIRTKATPDSAR